MTAIVFTVQADALAFKAQVDATLGYPRPGVNIGGGRHGPGGVTTGYDDVKKHPTLPLWAHSDDGPVQSLVTTAKVAIPATGAVQALDATWTPAPVLTAQVDTP